jgi:chemotaxis protein MotA
MDFATTAGLVFGSVVIYFLVAYEGDAGMFLNYHAAIVIFGGAAAATMVRFPFGAVLHGLPMGIKYSFTLRSVQPRELIDEIAGFAEIVRKSGPIGLEKVEPSDPFLAKGVRFLADGYDADFIRDTMERDRDHFLTHLDEGSKVYRSIGDCAPAFGMIGTLIGMVQMFANMSDPSKLGGYMAVALLATLYGAVLANLICLPIADKLHVRLIDEEISRSLIIDGILMMREQKSPQLVKEMLVGYLPDHHKAHFEAEAEAA